MEVKAQNNKHHWFLGTSLNSVSLFSEDMLGNSTVNRSSFWILVANSVCSWLLRMSTSFWRSNEHISVRWLKVIRQQYICSLTFRWWFASCSSITWSAVFPTDKNNSLMMNFQSRIGRFFCRKRLRSIHPLSTNSLRLVELSLTGVSSTFGTIRVYICPFVNPCWFPWSEIGCPLATVTSCNSSSSCLLKHNNYIKKSFTFCDLENTQYFISFHYQVFQFTCSFHILFI